MAAHGLSELDMRITREVAHHNYRDSEDTFVKESCGDMVKLVPTSSKFDIVEYNVSHMGRIKLKVLMWICVLIMSYFLVPPS